METMDTGRIPMGCSAPDTFIRMNVEDISERWLPCPSMSVLKTFQEAV